MVSHGDAGEILTLVDALNYLGAIGLLVAGFVVAVAIIGRAGDVLARRRCRRSHPASVGRGVIK